MTAVIGRVLQALPATFHVLLEGFLEARRGRDYAVLEAGGVQIARHIQRRHHFLVEARTLLQHGLRGFQTGVFETGDLRDLVDTCQMLHGKQHVFHGCDVCHRDSFFIQRNGIC